MSRPTPAIVDEGTIIPRRVCQSPSPPSSTAMRDKMPETNNQTKVARGAGRPGGKAALYARLSKTDEGEMDNQLLRLREWAENLGYDEVETYHDRASGATLDRPDLDRLLADVRTGTFDAVLVVRIDRLMRSVINLLSVLEHCSTYNTSLKVLDQPIDTSTAMGRLVLTILAAIAEFERELIRDRTMDGLERARKEGTQLGRKAKKFSDEFYDRLVTGRDEGRSWSQLSDELGKPVGTLRDHYRRVAVDVLPDDTSEEHPRFGGRQSHGSHTGELSIDEAHRLTLEEEDRGIRELPPEEPEEEEYRDELDDAMAEEEEGEGPCAHPDNSSGECNLECNHFDEETDRLDDGECKWHYLPEEVE